MTNETIGMILSLFGMCANISSFQVRKKGTLLIIQTIGSTLFSISFFFSGGGIGGLMNILLLLRNFIFLGLKDKKGKIIPLTVIGLCISYVIGLLLYNFVWAAQQSVADKWWNVFPVLGGIIGTIAFSFTQLKLLRIVKFGDSASWLAYNVHIGLGALGGILCEIFSICSIAIALFRYREKKQKIKAVIFDMDGTLVDSEPLHKISRDSFLEKLGLSVEENSDKAFKGAKRVFWQEMVDTYGLAQTNEELTVLEFKALIGIIQEQGVPKTKGIEELLSALKEKGIKMAVASASDKEYVEFILQYMHWEKYFSVVVCGNDVKQAKPAPDVYLLALERLGVDKKETLAVEDSRMGSRAASAAGIKCIGYDAETLVEKQDLSCCEKTVQDMRDILSMIN